MVTPLFVSYKPCRRQYMNICAPGMTYNVPLFFSLPATFATINRMAYVRPDKFNTFIIYENLFISYDASDFLFRVL